jgi:hypothetical protein
MIVKSQKGGAYYTILFFAVIGTTGLLAGIIGFIIPVCFGNGIEAWLKHTGSGTATLLIMGIVGGLYQTPFVAVLWRDATNILIDTDKKTISLVNMFTKRQQTFSLDEFSGYMYDYEQSRYYVNGNVWRNDDRVKLIYLLQAGGAEIKISSAYYINFHELEKALYPIPFIEQ